MHPAASVILFTTSSGAGYGLLALLGVLAPLGVPADRWFGLAGIGLALALVTLGLAASTFHLRHPERAWRAISQWRSSWLSREGLAAIFTYVPALAMAAGWAGLGFGRVDGAWAAGWSAAGYLASLGAAATVFCTGMIYAVLKPVRQWRDPLVVPVYLAFALATGAVWLHLLAQAFRIGAPWTDLLAAAALLLAWSLKGLYWRRIAAPDKHASTPESATGLGHFGTVRLLDPPHTEENYLLREMGFRVARKHAAKLRRLAWAFGLAAPLALLALGRAGPGEVAAAAALLAALSAVAGVTIERWLFFAEARHTVTLYYGG